MNGAGGTEGGIGKFFLGLAMLIAGGYLFFNSIEVGFHWGRGMYRMGNFNVTGGMVLFPFIIGIGFIFYNFESIIGWILSAASVIMLTVGVISSINFHMRRMTSFDLMMILTLMFGGLGLFLSSLKGQKRSN
ncbi:MAG: hypothetical protein HRT88_12805 [Lentisphaeraceae bacterium]|nr:hypothetical protein [Lentisphaeraceae bacterium]